MKQMLWILTVSLLPSLSFAQSRGDMLPFQGPTGAMSTLANKNKRSTADEEQTALAKVLGNLSEEGKAFKQVIDGFKLMAGLLLSNGQQDDAAVAEKVVSELVSQGNMAEAFNSYITIQKNRGALLNKALETSITGQYQNLPAKDISEAYLGTLVNRYLDKKNAESQKRAMLNERQALLRYLNQLDGVLLSDYLNDNLEKCNLSQEELSQAKRWQQELAAAMIAPML